MINHESLDRLLLVSLVPFGLYPMVPSSRGDSKVLSLRRKTRRIKDINVVAKPCQTWGGYPLGLTVQTLDFPNLVTRHTA